MMVRNKKGKFDGGGITFTLKGYGYNGTSVSKVLGCSIPTGIKKLKDPTLFTIGDLLKLSKDGVDLDRIFDQFGQ